MALSALALYARLLRDERDMLQEDFADGSGLGVNTIKNIENDRPVKFDTIVKVYRDGIKPPRRPLSDDEWSTLAIHWMNSRAGKGGRFITPTKLQAGAATAQGAEAAQLAEVAAAAKKLPTGNQRLLVQIATLMQREPFVATLESLVKLCAGKK